MWPFLLEEAKDEIEGPRGRSRSGAANVGAFSEAALQLRFAFQD
jgi:hypothetical protein